MAPPSLPGPACSKPAASSTASGLLSSPMSSLAAARHPSHISKAYRQASTLFLTRRLPEALTTLSPLIVPAAGDGHGEPAPVAAASRTSRIKVWSLYLTILNAILDMEPDEAKDAFGNPEWRALCAKVRAGDVWEDVVRNGYHGAEGDVDADVVINLATLLLAHAPDQTVNQRRLETYLAASAAPDLDLAGGRLASTPAAKGRYRSPAPGTSGANTPRDLHARVKILELYTLHVLARNDEWDYARDFIAASAVLDDERREAFLQALQSLRDERQERERLEREHRQRQEEQLRREVDEARRQRAENEERERRRLDEERVRRRDEGSEAGAADGDEPPARRTNANTNGGGGGGSTSRPPQQRPARPGAKAVAAAPRATFTAQAALMLSRLRAVAVELASSLNGNPVLLTRLLVFVVGLLVALGHRGIRQRIQRALGASWSKVKATASMGTKVSYI